MAKPRVPKKTVTATPAVDAAPASVPLTAAVPATEGNGTAVAVAPRKSTGKPTIVKSEPRPNLLPINLEDEIRRLAYLLSERRGFEPGHEAEDWLNAEREVRQRYHQQSA